ncbi:MAG: radical SAM protein [Candidatus Woesearchaeota archaeon]
MKVLLISPALTVSDRYGKDLGKVGPTTEPLGLAYLAGSLKQKGHEVKILDAAVLKYSLEDIKKFVSNNKFDLIGIGVLTPMYKIAKDTIKTVKGVTDTLLVVGGAHITIMPKATLEDIPEIDIGVVGEGEETILELVEYLEGEKKLENIKGIVFRKENEIVENELREFMKNLDDAPLPAREELPMEKYTPAPTYYKKLPSYVMLISRGCPYRCVYCSKIAGRMYRHHSIDRLMKEVEILMNEYSAKEIIFRDDTFTINRDHVVKLCNQIIEKGYNKRIKWTCMTRVNLVDFELLKLMKKAGCWSIHYGIESGNQRLLNLIKKDITLAQAKTAIKWTRKAGIETKAFFMLGLPTETREESLQTLKFTKDLNPDWIQVTITVPYPGTELYDLAKKDGTLKSLKWEEYQTWAGWSNKELVYVPGERNAAELKELQKKAMRQFYLRPKTILRMIYQLRSLSMAGKYFAGGMALIKSGLKKR